MKPVAITSRGRSFRALRHAATWAWLITLCGSLILGPVTLRAQGAGAKEHQVKALFVLNFIQFVEWPAHVFASPDAPIHLGVLGNDPIGTELMKVIEGERIRQRPLRVTRSERLADLDECHLILVGRSARAQMNAVINQCGGLPVLTVADLPDFARRGGMINFYLEGQKVRFEINRAAAHAAGLKMSSQLLSLARIVGPAMAKGGE